MQRGLQACAELGELKRRGGMAGIVSTCSPHYHTLPSGGQTNMDCFNGIGSGRVVRLGQAPVRDDIKKDILAGTLAFAIPLVYDRAAPKKWKRYGMVGNLVGVVGIYFGLRWVYNRWWWLY